jgi:hypothetical protein
MDKTRFSYIEFLNGELYDPYQYVWLLMILDSADTYISLYNNGINDTAFDYEKEYLFGNGLICDLTFLFGKIKYAVIAAKWLRRQLFYHTKKQNSHRKVNLKVVGSPKLFYNEERGEYEQVYSRLDRRRGY